jgi:hypothetical protein
MNKLHRVARKNLLIMIIYLLPCFSVLKAQQIKSEITEFHLNNIKIEKPAPDTIAPEIVIISPAFDENNELFSKRPEIKIIGKVIDEESGVSKIFINDEFFELPEDGHFVKSIPLEIGLNEISITAIDQSDNFSEKNLAVEYLIKSSSATAQLKVNGKYYALLIGINEYEDPNFTNLDNPITDAESLYDVLISDYLFEKENVKFIKNAKITDIYNALDELSHTITENDNLLLFYAGHGWWDEEANIGYWLPSDARMNRKAEWFRNSTLCDYLKEINSKHTLVVTDACFGGAIFKTRGVSMETSKAIQMLYDMKSRKAMTSGTLTQVPDRSAFVKYLINRLAENREKYISSEQLFASFRIAVINNSDVVPQYGEIRNVGDEGGDFIFIKKD